MDYINKEILEETIHRCWSEEGYIPPEGEDLGNNLAKVSLLIHQSLVTALLIQHYLGGEIRKHVGKYDRWTIPRYFNMVDGEMVCLIMKNDFEPISTEGPIDRDELLAAPHVAKTYNNLKPKVDVTIPPSGGF